MYSLVACVTFLFSPLVMCKWFCMEIWSLLCCFWGDCNTRGRLLRSLPRFVILAVVSTVIGFQGHGLVKYGHNYLHFKAQTFSSVSSVCFKKNFTWQNAGLILWTWSVQCCWKLTKKKKRELFFDDPCCTCPTCVQSNALWNAYIPITISMGIAQQLLLAFKRGSFVVCLSPARLFLFQIISRLFGCYALLSHFELRLGAEISDCWTSCFKRKCFNIQSNHGSQAKHFKEKKKEWKKVSAPMNHHAHVIWSFQFLRPCRIPSPLSVPFCHFSCWLFIFLEISPRH